VYLCLSVCLCMKVSVYVFVCVPMWIHFPVCLPSNFRRTPISPLSP
jgi:hypothetical protein